VPEIPAQKGDKAKLLPHLKQRHPAAARPSFPKGIESFLIRTKKLK
jgi:hypothetical protein